MENQTEAQAEVQQPQGPELSINDLKNLRTIIDVAVRRGTFGAGELSGVGSTFDRLNAFLNAVAPAEQAPAEQAQAPAAE